ncbi:MAG TPA: PspC domain-containing protein [Bryobacteraceae bacterium]|nr:PspC domain-containing protein [Bryobacteraceae bacterium]
MFCTRCGKELDAAFRFCPGCGLSTAAQGIPCGTPDPLMRSAVNRKIAGVCAGLARYTNVDPTVMRILWLLLLFGLPPAGVLGYIAAWIIMPVEPLSVYTATPATPPPHF